MATMKEHHQSTNSNKKLMKLCSKNGSITHCKISINHQTTDDDCHHDSINNDEEARQVSIILIKIYNYFN